MKKEIRYSKPILLYIKLYKLQNPDYSFDDIAEYIKNSYYGKYLSIIKDDSKIGENKDAAYYSKELYFNICRINIYDNKFVWKFCNLSEK